MTVAAGFKVVFNDLSNSFEVQNLLIGGLTCVVCGIAFKIFQTCKEKVSEIESMNENRNIKVGKSPIYIDLDEIIIH